MHNTLLHDIKDTLVKCDDILLENKKLGSSLEPQLVIRATRYRGRFHIREIDDNTVSVKCDPKNAHGTYYRFNLVRDEDNHHIRIKLTDHAWDDAFGAMGEDYYRKPLDKLAECVETYTLSKPQPNKLMLSLKKNRFRLYPFVAMPFFDTPCNHAFIFSGHPLMIYVSDCNGNLVISIVTDKDNLDNLYSITLNNNHGVVINRLNYKETLLPDIVVFGVNTFVGHLQKLLTTNGGE